MFLQTFSLKEKLLLTFQSIVFLGLFLYSFSQIDLGLTFSKITFLRNIVTYFQHIGYFERPLSAELYILIILLLTMFYCITLFFAARKKIQKKYVWTVIGIAVVLLTFSYNAFSYDIFNYIFDAKILTHYYSNPYLHKALDYPADPMLSFMHWTHRVYPYGPLWLVLTVPLSFIGLQVFLLTFFFFKLLMASAYVGTLYAIGKVFQKIAPEKELFGLLFFGLNPLVIIESLVSAHIDVVMMFFGVAAFAFLVSRKYTKSYITLAISVGIKFLTGILFPVFIALHFLEKKKKTIHWETVFFIIIFLMIIGVVIESYQSGNFQPWYLLAPLSFVVFLSHRYYIIIPSIIISVFSLFMYLPYLYLGNWDPPVPQVLSDIRFASYSISFFLTSVVFLYKQIVFVQHKRKLKKK